MVNDYVSGFAIERSIDTKNFLWRYWEAVERLFDNPVGEAILMLFAGWILYVAITDKMKRHYGYVEDLKAAHQHELEDLRAKHERKLESESKAREEIAASISPYSNGFRLLLEQHAIEQRIYFLNAAAARYQNTYDNLSKEITLSSPFSLEETLESYASVHSDDSGEIKELLGPKWGDMLGMTKDYINAYQLPEDIKGMGTTAGSTFKRILALNLKRVASLRTEIENERKGKLEISKQLSVPRATQTAKRPA